MKHSSIEVSQESVSRQLIDSVHELAGMGTHTAETAAEYLQNYYHGHMFVNGQFDAKATCHGYGVVTFKGTICGQEIGHEVSFY